MQTMVSTPTLPDDYPQLLVRLKREIGAARTRAALAVNEELIKLYWRIGREILARQENEGWGTKIIDRLAADLRAEFPEMTGLSRSNIHYMRQFAAAWRDRENVPQAVGHLPWGHVRCLLASRNETVARYALQGIHRPVGVARYTSRPTLVEQVPKELHDQLPELEEISAGVQRIVERHADEITEAEADAHSRSVESPLLPATPRRGKAVAPSNALARRSR